jgi:SSS family solute:Na+ symporter/sodium/pantothenate symporter
MACLGLAPAGLLIAQTGLPEWAGLGAVVALVVFIGASLWLGAAAQRAVEKGSFLSGYFLGNRGLGAWTLALTATVQSGGTFMGFPSLVYTHGWIVALWIAGYMVVPLTGFGVLGKRIAQLCRRTEAITVPDLFRSRFDDPRVGLAASLFIIFFMSSMMVAQFKAGALVMKIAFPGSGTLALTEDGLPPLEPAAEPSSLPPAPATDWLYLLGLGIFTITVVGYTLMGGFLAAVWTDLFQSVMMFVGVLLLLCLALWKTGGLEESNRRAVERTGPGFIQGPGFEAPPPPGALRTADEAQSPHQFLPVTLAISYFFVWVFSGMGSPASLVRIMASKDTDTIRRSIFLLSSYNAFIYIPLVVICIGARAVLPDLGGKSDEVIPRMALWCTEGIPGGSLVTGLILAAPFGAVMATVSSYLVVIASGLVRDVYLRWIHPQATGREIRLVTYTVMIVVGLLAVGLNVRPVAYLQAIVVFSGSSAAATFVVPALMAAYWRRATANGTLAAMFAGAGVMLSLYAAGWIWGGSPIDARTPFSPLAVLGFHPIVWGLTASVLAGVVVSLMTTPPPAAHISRLFDRQ